MRAIHLYEISAMRWFAIISSLFAAVAIAMLATPALAARCDG